MLALEVTIVVLLILEGITIQLPINDGGIFSQVQRSKEQTRIGELLDKFNVLEATVSFRKVRQTTKVQNARRINHSTCIFVKVIVNFFTRSTKK